MTTPAALLSREARLLTQRLRLWTPARFVAITAAGTRADLVHHLAQSLADRAAGLEGEPRRLLPRLDSDLGLADQLAVTADDLVRADPPRSVVVAVTAHLLLHRTQLLEDDVPAALAAALGLADVLAAGAQECKRDEKGIAALDGQEVAAPEAAP
ncbi:MAG: hypothetical protein H7323_09460 [Frankiales bacterium]|nr:hypothetical protein [Frankiales bacterium]